MFLGKKCLYFLKYLPFKNKSHGEYTVTVHPSNVFGLMKFNLWRISLLPIKGNQIECKNWREITLQSMANKIINHIINKRLSDYISPRLRKGHARFRAHKSCVDHVNNLQNFVHQSVEWRTCSLCFMDFAKAFRIRVLKCVRQGFVLFPLPFNIVLDTVTRGYLGA